MEENYSVIFQMPFIHEGIRGVADFLLREEYGNGKVAYEPVDSKLSRTGAKQGHLLQLLFLRRSSRSQKLEYDRGKFMYFLVQVKWNRSTSEIIGGTGNDCRDR